MAIDTAAISARVASLTADLEPAAGTTAQDLDEARAALAVAISAGQPDIQTTPSVPSDLLTGAARFAASDTHVQSIVTSILAKPPAVQQLVNRRSFSHPLRRPSPPRCPIFRMAAPSIARLGGFAMLSDARYGSTSFSSPNNSGSSARPARLRFLACR